MDLRTCEGTHSKDNIVLTFDFLPTSSCLAEIELKYEMALGHFFTPMVIYNKYDSEICDHK